MHKFLTVFALNILFTLKGFTLETTYEWRQIKERNLSKIKSLYGKCFEVDVKTQGSFYQNIVDTSKCRPSETFFLFNRLIGKCFEVDLKTEGQLYYVKAHIDKCKPSKTSFVIGEFLRKPGCFEVDQQSYGEQFYKKVDLKKCDNNYSLMWELKKESYGNCFRVSENSLTGQKLKKLKVKNIECRPVKTSYNFIRKDDFSGRCYEVHPEGPHKYINKTKLENCRPQETVFIFYRKDMISKGVCYEVDSETKGDHYLKRVKIHKCKEQ